MIEVQNYLWYPYLKYQAECRAKGKEDSIQEWLELTGKVVVSKPKPKSKSKPKRARNKKGHYVPDDPNTPENEAWVGGVAPKRKRGRPRKVQESK